jgi:glycine cleavage system transcriptional repressor
MAILGGEFALILLYSGTGQGMARVDAELPGLEERLQLRIAVRDTTRAASTRSHLPYRIRVSGVDRPGIVARVSHVLAIRGINVESLESRVSPAPHSGTPLFLLRAELQVPSETALSALRAELSQVCDEENLDLLLEAG